MGHTGSEQFSQGSSLDQDIFEITDSFTFSWNAHRFTIGTRNEFYKIVNVFTESCRGVRREAGNGNEKWETQQMACRCEWGKRGVRDD